jgi:hypothetical protein
MWERPRPTRTEIVSIDSGRLARHALAHHFRQAGLVRVRADAVANGTLLSIASHEIGVDTSPENYHWFRSQKDLDAVFHEMVTLEAMPWVASRVEGGILLNVSVENVSGVIAECIRWCSRLRKYAPNASIYVNREEIDERIASVKTEIDRTLVRLQVTGFMSKLNKQFKELRTLPRADGEKMPSYKIWATKQLEARVLQLIATAPNL